MMIDAPKKKIIHTNYSYTLYTLQTFHTHFTHTQSIHHIAAAAHRIAPHTDIHSDVIIISFVIFCALTFAPAIVFIVRHMDLD